MKTNKAEKLFKLADKERYAIGAFNAASLETFKAITEAAKKLNSPILIEASEGEIRYIGVKQMVSLARNYEEELQIPIVLNHDHGSDVTLLKEAINEGFDYVHFDGSKLPYDQYVKDAAEIVKYAHNKGVMVEGEIDHIEGSSADHTGEKPSDMFDPKFFTTPEKAKHFVESTEVDVFASFVGNPHGIYADYKHLDIPRLKEIKEALPHTYLSLHGGSGIFEDDVKSAIQAGVVKVNINSEMRIAFKMTLQEVLNNSKEIAVYKFMQKPIEEVRKVVEKKITLFGSSGRLKIK